MHTSGRSTAASASNGVGWPRTDGRHAGVELFAQAAARPPREQQRDGPGEQRAEQARRQVRRLRQASHVGRARHAHCQRRRGRAALRDAARAGS